MYRNSQAWRAGEEFAAQTLTTGSIRQGVGQLLKPGYRLNPYRVAGEALGLSSLVGAFVYRNDIRSGIQAILDAESVEGTEERGVRGPVITGSAK